MNDCVITISAGSAKYGPKAEVWIGGEPFYNFVVDHETGHVWFGDDDTPAWLAALQGKYGAGRA